MSDPKKTPQIPKQQPPQRPKDVPCGLPERVRKDVGLPPVDQTPPMPPVKPPKKD